MRIALVAFDSFTDIDLHLAWDLFRRVPDLDTRIVAAAPRVTSSTGLAVEVHGGLDEVGTADAVYVTSGRGSRAVAKDPAWLAALRLDPARQIIAAIDSGALILAAAGLLRGKRATTYPSPDLHDALTGLGVEVVNEHLVVEGNVATAAQCLAGVDLAAWVIERLRGPAAAEAAVAAIRPLGR